MSEKKEFYIDKFRGGMATTYSNDNIGPTSDNPLEEFPIIDNWDYTKRGAFEKRPGLTNMLIARQDLLDLGISEAVITDNGFDDTVYDGTFDTYFKYEAKGFYEQSDGSYKSPEPEDQAYDIRMGMMNGNLVVLNFNDTLLDTTSKFTVFPTKVVLGSLNKGVNIGTVQFGNELYMATGDGYYVLRLIRRYSSAPVYDEYELEARRMDSPQEIYYPDANEIFNFGTNIFDDFNYVPNSITLSQLEDAITGIRTFPYTVSTSQPTKVNIQAKLTDVTIGDAVARVGFIVKFIDPSGTTVETVIRDVNDSSDLTFTPLNVGKYTIKVELETKAPVATVDIKELNLEVYDGLNFVPAENLNEEINNCTRLFLYYNRIILYSNGTGTWYKSDINRPSYFTPFCETDFAAFNPESTVEVLQSVTPYRNSLIVITEKTMFLTTGKGDDFPDLSGAFHPFNSIKISDKGTMSPYTVAKSENNLIFLSNDGIYVLDAVYVDEKKANLYKISDMVDNLVIKNEKNASAVVFNNRYYINFPSKNYTLKWDYVYGQKIEGKAIPERLWSRDISTELKFKNMKVIGEDLFFLVEADLVKAKLLRLNREGHLTSDIDKANLIESIYPQGYFTDDGIMFQSVIETKAYNFDDKSRMKKLKQIILELFFGNYTLIYTANENPIIDSKLVPAVIQDEVEGRIVYYSGVLEKNITIDGNFILGDAEVGILGNVDMGNLAPNILGGIDEQYVYYPLKKSSYAQKHKIVLAHSEDAFAKILGFGFIYMYGKKPKNKHK